MIPLFKVRMSPDAGEAVRQVLDSGFIGQGPKVEKFEDLLWEELGGATRPITVNSCTSAIDLALQLCEVGLGDEVISTPQTCFASQVGAIHRGATLRWADIDPESGLISPQSVEALITPKTKAIIAVDWAGKLCDYVALKQFGAPVIEDAAHCWDAFIQRPVARGDYICYSFQAIKFLTSSDGGLLIAPSETEDRARLLRWYGLDRTKNQSFRCTQNITEAGFKYHMNDVCASIGIANIAVARASVKSHQANAKIYCSELNGLRSIKVPAFDPLCSYWLYSLLVTKGTKEEFMQFLADRNIASSPVHYRNDLYDCTMQFQENDLPGVTAFHKQQVSVPVGWWLSPMDVEYIVAEIKKYDELMG
jgi:dTDP-4-amino-4,6-dideoxygalactose transaminase